LEEGYDITKDCIPVVPAQHYFMGGVYVDLDGLTSMKHLYAAGETCCNGVHGRNRLASNSLLESLVFAKNAANHMKKTDEDWGAEHRRYHLMDVADLPLGEILERYDIDLKEYEDLDRYFDENKAMIWGEIHKEEKERKAL
jgi:L-aspartate oxidase